MSKKSHQRFRIIFHDTLTIESSRRSQINFSFKNENFPLNPDVFFEIFNSKIPVSLNLLHKNWIPQQFRIFLKLHRFIKWARLRISTKRRSLPREIWTKIKLLNHPVADEKILLFLCLGRLRHPRVPAFRINFRCH